MNVKEKTEEYAIVPSILIVLFKIEQDKRLEGRKYKHIETDS